MYVFDIYYEKFGIHICVSSIFAHLHVHAKEFYYIVLCERKSFQISFNDK